MSFGSIGKFIGDQRTAPTQEQYGLTEAVAKHLDNAEETYREPGFHISQLFKFCPVKWTLQQISPKAQKWPFRTRFRFDIGHALHEMLQRYFGDMGILKGYWKCEFGHKTKTIATKPKTCPESGCKSDWLRYAEIGLRQEIKPGYDVVGKTDGVLFWEGEDVGLEIKSVEPEVIGTLSKPFDYPIHQLNCYMHLLRKSHFPNMRRGIIMYVAAGGKDTILLPMKQFAIDYTDIYWNSAVGKIEEAAALYDGYLKGTLGPQDLIAKRTCATKADGRKVDCPVLEDCFNVAGLVKTFEAQAQKLKGERT